MARSHLTLAALATSAVPGLTVVGSGPLGLGATGDYDSALLRTADDREVVVRVPASQRAETDQAREMLALSALTEGTRSRLPFEIPVVLGQSPAGHTRAVVSSYLPGFQVAAGELPAGDGVATSIGGALAALHSLPGSFVGDAGLPSQTAEESRREASSVVERALATRLLPAAVASRWGDAIADDALWQFKPTVVNGTVSAESFIVGEHEAGQIVVGMIGWSGLRVSDPAHDLHWLSAAGEAADSVFAAYTAASARTPDSRIRVRAMLYAELELARWLLHGRDVHDQTIVDDAVAMLDGLVEHVLGDVMHPLSQHTGPVLSVDDVETLLASTPRPPSESRATGMETDSYDRSEIENALGRHDGAEPDDEGQAAEDEPAEATDVAPGDLPAAGEPADEAETGPIDILDGSLRASLGDEERARRVRASARETVEFDVSAWSRAADGQGASAEPTDRSQSDRSSSSE
jgi:hypothetical protein